MPGQNEGQWFITMEYLMSEGHESMRCFRVSIPRSSGTSGGEKKPPYWFQGVTQKVAKELSGQQHIPSNGGDVSPMERNGGGSTGRGVSGALNGLHC